MPVITGAAEYPANLVEKIKAEGVRIITADALALAREAGNEKAANVVLIGVMAHHLGLEMDVIEKALRMSVPEKFLELNLRAFELGKNIKED